MPRALPVEGLCWHSDHLLDSDRVIIEWSDASAQRAVAEYRERGVCNNKLVMVERSSAGILEVVAACRHHAAHAVAAAFGHLRIEETGDRDVEAHERALKAAWQELALRFPESTPMARVGWSGFWLVVVGERDELVRAASRFAHVPQE